LQKLFIITANKHRSKSKTIGVTDRHPTEKELKELRPA
jgi:hypothetical protein